MTTNTIIRFENVSKSYNDGTIVLKNINFELEKGKFYTLLGPSGCGKTTILPSYCWFHRTNKRRLYFNDKKINQCLPMNAK